MESDLVQQRKRKLDEWVAAGHLRYPYSFAPRDLLSRVREASEPLSPTEVSKAQHFRVAGRLVLLRRVGKNTFAPMRDGSGELQVHFQSDHLGADVYDRLTSALDAGDIVGIDGFASRTKSGEPSLLVNSIELLAKALRPLPEKWHGLQDPEARLRQRYVDLLTSPRVLKGFEARSTIVSEMRRYLGSLGFLEVETPVLSRVASGGQAHPFVTHYRFLEEDFRMRVALELPLKRLLVGGFERVFEIGKVFRNEDLDAEHSPEFTMMELYWAYADYTDVRHLVEGLTQELARVVSRFLSPEDAAARMKDFTPPYPTVDYVEALERESGISGIVGLPREHLIDLARKAGAKLPDAASHGAALDKLFGHYVESRLVQPTFVLDYPVETTPLAKRHRSKEGRVERFELFYKGFELGNAYSELNDPEDQEQRFRAQLPPPGSEELEETYAYDADFVEALRYGMPPAGGLGMGVDRLVMAMLGLSSVKDVILFPPTRSK